MTRTTASAARRRYRGFCPMSLFFLSIHVLSLVVVVCAESSNISTSSSLFLPRDVAFDSAARKTLQRMRRDGNHGADELSSSGSHEHVTMTMVGYKGGSIHSQINQDRAFVLAPFFSDGLLLGVLDGHGDQGEVVAEYARRELPKLLWKKLTFIQDLGRDEELIKTALTESFVQVDQSIPTNGVGGCTASIVLQLGTKLYIANAGDSVSIVATYNSLTESVDVIYTTREDKPDLPDEHERILKMGGSVYIPNDPYEDTPRVVYTDPNTGYQTGLAMSRSIGDWEMVGVIAEPIVDVIDLENVVTAAHDTSSETCADNHHVHVFVISATDGMMDYVGPQTLAKAFATAFYRKDGPHPLTAAEDVILQAAKGWNIDMGGDYRDDIAVAASKITIPQKEDSESS